MNYLKILGLITLSALALMAVVGASAASATTLEITGVKQNGPVKITISEYPSTVLVLRDTFFISANSCTEVHWTKETTSYTPKPRGPALDLALAGCENSITVHDAGAFAVEWTSGTNGRIYSEGAELTVFSSIHNTYITCTTAAAGTLIGTLTGVGSGSARIDVNATLNCGEHLSSAKWTGTWVITSPHALGVVS